jgi:hypothetical protein
MKDKIVLYVIKVKGGRFFSYIQNKKYVLVKRESNSGMLNYQDACAIAFDLNKQQGSLDYAVIETAETV